MTETPVKARAITCNLSMAVERRGLNRSQIAMEVEGKASGTSVSAIYRLLAGKQRSINLDALAETLDAIERLSGEPLTLSEILQREADCHQMEDASNEITAMTPTNPPPPVEIPDNQTLTVASETGASETGASELDQLISSMPDIQLDFADAPAQLPGFLTSDAPARSPLSAVAVSTVAIAERTPETNMVEREARGIANNPHLTARKMSTDREGSKSINSERGPSHNIKAEIPKAARELTGSQIKDLPSTDRMSASRLQAPQPGKHAWGTQETPRTENYREKSPVEDKHNDQRNRHIDINQILKPGAPWNGTQASRTAESRPDTVCIPAVRQETLESKSEKDTDGDGWSPERDMRWRRA